ncbi:branched-chain amino acid ABC transporter permease [Oscillospiraceae bacterium MB08-C2-2]|nr:branched-chain amino acid ABC transporter permease [Oscillospiraceae bacterium MB08-C2-2]
MRQVLDTLKGFYRQHRVLVFLALLVVMILLPVLFPKSYFMGVMCRILIYSVLAGALNAINGYSGQTCLGMAGFFCIGSYCEAILAVKAGWNFWMILPIAGIVTAAIGFVLAIPTLKMSGIYLSIVTLGFSEIVRLIALNWTGLTGGPMGIKGIPVPSFFGFEIKNSRSYYYIFLALAVLFIFVTNRVIKSRVGRAWISIREDQLAARSLGVQASRYKALNFTYGAFWAGLAGACYAPYVRFIDSTFFTLDEGWNILSMVIIGGQGTLVGPVVGSVLVNFLTEWLRPIGQWRMVAYALLIIVIMWCRPQGLVGSSDSILAGRSIRRKVSKDKKKEGARV